MAPMNPDQQSQLLALIQSEKWWLVGALALSLALGALVRALKDDVSWTPTIPARWRPVVTTVVGLAAGVLASLAGGMPLIPALVLGLTSGVTPVAAHEVVVNGLRGGRDFFVKKDGATGGAGRAALLLLFIPSMPALALLIAACTKQEAKDAADEITKDVNRAALICAALVPLVPSDQFDQLCLAAQDIAPIVQNVARDIFGARKRDALRRGLKVPE